MVQLDRWCLTVVPNTNAMKNICNCDLTNPPVFQTSTSLTTVNALAQASNLASASSASASSSATLINPNQKLSTVTDSISGEIINCGCNGRCVDNVDCMCGCGCVYGKNRLAVFN